MGGQGNESRHPSFPRARPPPQRRPGVRPNAHCKQGQRPAAVLTLARCRVPLAGAFGLRLPPVGVPAYNRAAILSAQNRITRPAILPMMTALGIILIWFRTDAAWRGELTKVWSRWILVGLVGLSWCVLLWQLLLAFDRGRIYAHAAFRLEYFNYPLHLRELAGPDDSHTCDEPCPYDRP